MTRTDHANRPEAPALDIPAPGDAAPTPVAAPTGPFLPSCDESDTRTDPSLPDRGEAPGPIHHAPDSRPDLFLRAPDIRCDPASQDDRTAGPLLRAPDVRCDPASETFEGTTPVTTVTQPAGSPPPTPYSLLPATGAATEAPDRADVRAAPGGAEPADLDHPRETHPPRWYRPALWGLMAVALGLYVWNLAASGWANSFYAAAVQAGSQSWKAWFFGCSDMACSITVDKPPASLWVMGLSARIFGFSSWSMLIPQAVMGAASVGVLFAGVRRWYGTWAGLIAGIALALTPVASLMFRFDNPDALLTLLMVLAAYATIRAIEKGHTAWLVLAGAAVGFGFLTKMLQALLVLPALAIAFLWAAPTPLRKRFVSLLAAAGSMILSAGWYIAIVELMPASARPYIGGSTDNSILQLTLGYNGLNRITGDATGSMGAGGGMGGGYAGITRLFGTDMGGQIAWLLPAALIALVAGLVVTARARRTSVQRAGLVIWGGWLLVTGVVFSFMNGIIHAYYTVALAPAIAALVGIGAAMAWQRREALWARILLAVGVGATAATAWMLLSRSSDWLPWLRWTIAALAVLSAAGLLVTGAKMPAAPRRIVASLALIACLAGPTAYTIATVSQPHTGSIPSAGPSGVSMGGMGQGGPGGQGQGGPGGQGFPGQNGTQNGTDGNGMPAMPGQGTGGTTQNGTGMPAMPGQNDGTATQDGTGTATQGGTGTTGQMPQGGPGGQMGEGMTMGGGMGGFLDAEQASDAIVALLQTDAEKYDWVAATTGSNSAAGLQLSSGYSVMPIGGFNGGDDSPTLAQFQEWVKEGRIHYYISSGGGGMQAIGGSSSPSRIAQWVQDNYTAQTVDGTTVYDLTAS